MQMDPLALRPCFRDPIPEISDAYLDAAVSAHLAGQSDIADQLLRLADMPLLREWTESVWGTDSRYVHYHSLSDAEPSIGAGTRTKLRMPTLAEQKRLHLRDGYHCRFCGIPVIRREVRQRIVRAYPLAVPWGKRNADQHAAFQMMWSQYDHLLPHSKGGANDPDNIVVSYAPCNFGRMGYRLEEVGLADPRLRDPVRSAWDGLERFQTLR